MKLCRFDDDRLGLVQGVELVDVTAAIEALAPRRWPAPPGDAPQGAGGQSLEDRQRADQLPGAQSAAPASHRREIKTIADWGLFLKSSSSLIGPGEEIRLRFPGRRNDHEVELAVVIGRTANRVARADALSYVCGTPSAST